MEEMLEYAKHRRSLKGCYLLFEDYLHGKTSVFILKPSREIGQSFKKVYENLGKLVKNLETF